MAREKKVGVYETDKELSVALAKYVADLSNKVTKEKHPFTVVLSGGILIDCLRNLTEKQYVDSLDWKNWHIFWLDERVVPKDHPDSNYLLAYNGFLSKVPIPSDNIYAINDKVSTEDAAKDYEARTRQLVEKNIIRKSAKTGFPKFDLMLLGMGPDGHVASLFPKHPQVNETKKWVTFIKDSPKPPPERITFTFPVINSSDEIAMVITGAEEAEAVKIALGPGNNPDKLPVQLVSPEGDYTWFLDKAAASKIHS